MPKCTGALGVSSGKIAKESFKASSIWSSSYAPGNGRLNQRSTWIAKSQNNEQWLQIDLGQWKSVTRIGTQGRYDKDQWVKTYEVSSSLYGGHYDFYKENDQPKVLWEISRSRE